MVGRPGNSGLFERNLPIPSSPGIRKEEECRVGGCGGGTLRSTSFPLCTCRSSSASSDSSTHNGAYAKVRASLATALLRGKSIHALYESLWFVPCLLVVCLLLKRFFSSLARLAGSSATHTLRKNICWFFSWLVIGEGPELLDVGGQSSIAPLRRVTCRRSKSQSL